MASKSSKGIFLDVDSSILEQNLRLPNDPQPDDFSSLFGPGGAPECPSRLVKPSPGFCVKTREVGDDSKFFVNVCTTDAIPPPKDIGEDELRHILESDDPSNFRVPMSIGEVRTDKDKKGDEAKVCDVAVHPDFFKKIETQALFKHFFMTVVFEGLNNKYGIACADDKIILQNRKAFGSLQIHRIQQRDVKEKMGEPVSLMDEIGGPTWDRKPKIETISSLSNETKQPEYRLYRKRQEPKCLIGEFKFPDVISAQELTLDIGEDRILLEASSKNYLLDIFLPHFVRQNSCSSNFNKTTKILTVTMPLVGG